MVILVSTKTTIQDQDQDKDLQKVVLRPRHGLEANISVSQSCRLQPLYHPPYSQDGTIASSHYYLCCHLKKRLRERHSDDTELHSFGEEWFIIRHDKEFRRAGLHAVTTRKMTEIR